MKSSVTIPIDEQDHFWAVVRECIRTFHAHRASATLAAATRLRKKLDGMSIAQIEVFYHSEPFDVACNLADNPLDVTKHLKEYLLIRDSDAGRNQRRVRGA